MLTAKSPFDRNAVVYFMLKMEPDQWIMPKTIISVWLRNRYYKKVTYISDVVDQHHWYEAIAVYIK